MMILLDGHSLTAAGRFQPERLSVNLSERQSTATMTLPSGEPVLSVDDWVQDESGPAAGIVWRVKTIDEQFDKKTRTITLEHVIQTLKDQLMFGEVKSSDISGSSANPTAKQAVEYILARQSDWTLGDFYYTSVSNPYSFNGDDLFSAMETVSSSLEDCIWEYDFSAYPFTIHIHHMNSTICSEMRSDRNIRTLKKTIDRSRMYTRIYPIGKNNLHIDGNYLSKNENIYGVISHTETDQSQNTKAKLQAWAQERLDRHCEPAVTVTISGLELAELTGEPLDSFTIGKMCRVPLPEFSTTITERVTKLAYSDVISDPMSVTITLANEVQDVASILKQQSASSGRAGRTQAKDAEEDHAWIVDTTDHVSLIAEAVAGKDGDEPNWSRVSELTVDGNGIDARVTHAEGDIVDAFSAIQMTESRITMEVSAASSTLYSFVEQTASSLSSTIADTEHGLYSYVQQTASGTRQIMISTTNKTWIQENDPTTAAGGSHTVKDGDVWVQSTHQGTWDGADGFDWEHNEGFDWFDIQGAKIWGWANNKWELVSDQQQVVSYSDVVNTAELYLQQKLALIMNDEGLIDVYMSKLQQTATEIRAEVSAANSTIYSEIVVTASNILNRVGYQPRTITSTEAPSTVGGRSPVDDDVWIETQDQENWDKALDLAWDDDQDIDWNQIRSDRIHVWRDGGWKDVLDGTVLIEDADMEVERQQARLYGRKLEWVDGQLERYYGELKVSSKEIRAEVTAKWGDLGSRITQTATEIRAEVWDKEQGLQSLISQTASQIRSEVTDSANSLQSSITQNANKIALVVEGTGNNAHIKPASIVAAINDSDSSIAISAGHILLDGTTKINDVLGVYSGSILAKKSIYVEGPNQEQAITISNSGTITAANCIIRSGGGIEIRGDGTAKTIGYTEASGMIVKAQVDGNNLKLWKIGDSSPSITFSKATSLSGDWSGSTLTITASPQGNTYSIGFTGSPTVKMGITTNGSATKHSTLAAIVVPMKVCSIVGDNWTSRYTENITVTATNLEAGNIKKNVSIFGVTGTYEGQSRTDKGSSWYCTITQDSSGKHCKLSKDFGLSQNVPFSNGSSYHLYT